MKKSRLSLTSKFFFLLLLVLSLNAGSYFLILKNVYEQELQAQAKTVVANVEAFGAWVAKNGRVWVRADSSDSFLGEEEFINPKDPEQKAIHFFSKNPALAQREFSEAVMNSASPAKFRMTSHNVMNPRNAPDGFETRALEAIRNQHLKDFAEFSEGNYRYAQAIYHKASCISCHGDAGTAPADVIKRYGSSNGFGFKEGDVAGVISVTIPAASLSDSILKFIGPVEISLVIISIVIALWFVRSSFIKPVQRLTQAAHDISLGKDVNLALENIDDATRNEIDQLTLALNRLKSSTQIAIAKMRQAREAVNTTVVKAKKAIAKAKLQEADLRGPAPDNREP